MQNELSDRLEDFAVEIIRLVPKFQRNLVGRHIAGQLLRSCTSAGANYEEACGAESRSDFIHKLQIVLKELRECLYWLRLMAKSGLDSGQTTASPLKEGKELANIIAKSLVTAKKNK